MPTPPKISIVTPSFNQAEFLEDTIRSVLDQNYPNIEYVVIDGGSDDGSVEIIKKYEKKLAYWESNPDRGHAHAINKGFSHTTGEIMAWINSDDKYTPWSFETVSQVFSQFPEIDWIVGFNSYWNKRGAMTYAWRQPKNIYDFLIGNYRWIQQESCFWRRSLWEKAGSTLNESYRLMVDGELWSRFFLHAELYSVDCVLSGYRIHTDNRAIRLSSECISEMETAVNELRANCPNDYRPTWKKLQCLQSLLRMPVMKHLPLQYVMYKTLWSELYDTLAYKNIHSKGDQWIERRLPWSIYP